jgi:hypothetical protein
MQALVPPTHEERLRTIFLHKIPDGVGGDEGIEKLLHTLGRLRKWDSAKSHLSDHKGELFGFAQYEDPDSLAAAVELLKDLEVPLKKQSPTDVQAKDDDDDSFDDVEKGKLQFSVDENTTKYLESYQESRGDEQKAEAEERLNSTRNNLKQFVRDLFRPRLRKAQDADGDTAMGDVAGENVEVVNIPLAQEDELADIPAEMREVVAQEIAAFRERSIRRDMERLKREEEMEEMERQRNGLPRPSRLDSPPPGGASHGAGSNNIPLGPRGVPNAPSGPRGQGRIDFVNGGTTNGQSMNRDDEDTDASDEELNRREMAKKKADEEKLYLEAERKWVNRERQRAAALEREQERDKAELDSFSRRKEEQLEREKNWDDEKEAARKTHLYYRDHGAWVRKRAADRADEEARDEMDRRAEEDERRRHEVEVEQAKGMADSFLDRQAQEMERRPTAPAAPQKVTISFGAAAKAQAQRGPQRRTVAEVEGLLDDEEEDSAGKRKLVPIKFEPIDAKSMSEEDIQKAVRSLAQEIPTEKEGLWAWDVKWDYLEESIIQDKLRPFVEKKIMEYLGVQEESLVSVVVEHLRKHEKPGNLVDELAEVMDEDAEDLVKKLWRMVIFFTESEKRGLPA